VILLFFLLVLAVHVALDRFAPYTSEARLDAPVIAIASNVSGTLIEVLVNDNEQVRAGQVLARIDPQRYAAAVAQAAASLESASQSVGASTAGLAAARARVTEAEAQLAAERLQSGRVIELARRNVYSQAQADDSRARLARSEAGLQTAQATLAEAERRLGATDANNPQIRAAVAALDRAQIDLRDTDIRAPLDGALTNTVLAPGQFASAGRRIATVIDTQSAWVTANLPENALTRVRPGDRVELTFNALPGRIFQGRVDSLAFGVAQGMGPDGDLAYVGDRRRWVRETQRIPVRIDVERGADGPVVRVGSRAAIVVLPEEAGLVAPLARGLLRLVAVVNFAF
jgi:multidrug resistance efflux pump